MPFAAPPTGVRIFYEVHGRGAPLLLVSGTGHDHAFWSGQLPLLGARFRCVVFDNRGVGKSSAPTSWAFPWGGTSRRSSRCATRSAS